ncbi:MAG: helix-turn-helix domain-containing protein [Rhizobacter sp.]
MLTACRSPFKVRVGQQDMMLTAMAATHHLPRKTDARGTMNLTFRVAPVNSLFKTLSACGLLKLDRDMFADLDEQLLKVSQEQLTHAEAHALFNTVITRVASLLPQAPALDGRIRSVLSLLAHDPDRSLESLAREVGLSASRLSHLFTDTLGMSLRSYLTWRRVRVAWEHFISEERLSLTEIAHNAGFTDSSHFARTFHRFNGYTPSQARDVGFLRVVAR